MAEGPGCIWCAEGRYWICDSWEEPEPGDCDESKAAGPKWHHVRTQTLPAGSIKVWCKPGCDAILAEEKPAGPPPWSAAGSIDIPEAGDYDVWCRSGGGDRCMVKVKKA